MLLRSPRSLTRLVVFTLMELLAMSLSAQIGPDQQTTTRGAVGFDRSTGERTYSIRGQIFDENTNQPVERARVVLSAFGGGYLQNEYVDALGTFMFQDIRRGSYYITVSHPNYQDGEEHVEVAGGPVLGVVVYLKPKTRAAPPLFIEPIDVDQHLIPKGARKEFEQGVAQAQENKWQEALAHFDRAIELYPRFVSAFHARGVAWLRLGDAEKAAPNFEEAISLNPNAAAPRVLLAGIYNAQQRYPEAEQHLLRAIQLNPKSGLAHFQLSVCYWAQHNLDGAEASINRAHEFASQISQVHLLRANIFLVRQNYPGALGELDEFLKMVPTGPQADTARRQQVQVQDLLAQAKKP